MTYIYISCYINVRITTYVWSFRVRQMKKLDISSVKSFAANMFNFQKNKYSLLEKEHAISLLLGKFCQCYAQLLSH